MSSDVKDKIALHKAKKLKANKPRKHSIDEDFDVRVTEMGEEEPATRGKCSRLCS